jgi:putative ABC transport system permease protein
MWKDLLFSLRALRSNPLVTGVAVLSLALGIGANTAIFSLLQQVVLRSLPIQDPERLVVLHTQAALPGDSMTDTSATVYSYPLYRDLRDRDHAFSGLIARAGAPVRIAWQGATEAAKAEIVSGNFFRVLGVGAAAGRVIQPVDDGAPGANSVVVLRYGYWLSRFAGSPEILNQTVSVNGHPMVVVGVAAPQFYGLLQGQAPDVFVPISAQRIAMPTLDILEKRNTRWLCLFARLAPGTAPARAQSITDGVYRSLLEADLPQLGLTGIGPDRERYLAHRAELQPAAQGISELRKRWEKPLNVLMVMVGLVLLIACANVAGLLTARAAGRHREIAIRLALGASRSALVKQLLLEGVVLSLAGGAAALLVESWCAKGLLGLLPRQYGAGWIAAGLNLSLLSFTLVLAVLSGVIFSLAPALQATRPILASGLKDRSSQSSTAQTRFRRVLVTAQIALATLLVAGAGLFTLSLSNLLHIDLGFRTQRMLSFNLNATLDHPETTRATAFYRDLLARLSAIGSFQGVAAADSGPLGGGTRTSNLTVEGYQPAPNESLNTTVVRVSPGFFRMMGIPLRAGREFDGRDTADSPKAVVVNQSFAKRYFAGRDPVGQRLHFGAGNPPILDRQIVGLVPDSRIEVLTEPAITVYMPYTQWDRAQRMIFYVRTVGEESRSAADVLRVVRDADANLPAPIVRSADVRIRESLYTERLIAILSGAFGVLAALLAAIGVYGMMAHGVARRTNEIGVRMALGARPGDVRSMVLREAGRMVAIGLFIGLGGALALGRLVESELYGVRAANPAVLGGAAVLLAVIGLAAAAIPGWRASRIDPLEALRYE